VGAEPPTPQDKSVTASWRAARRARARPGEYAVRPPLSRREWLRWPQRICQSYRDM